MKTKKVKKVKLTPEEYEMKKKTMQFAIITGSVIALGLIATYLM